MVPLISHLIFLLTRPLPTKSWTLRAWNAEIYKYVGIFQKVFEIYLCTQAVLYIGVCISFSIGIGYKSAPKLIPEIAKDRFVLQNPEWETATSTKASTEGSNGVVFVQVT